MPEFHFPRVKNSDLPMAKRVYAGESLIGFVWRSWGADDNARWVLRLTPDGPDLASAPSKHAAAEVLWRIDAERRRQDAGVEMAVAS